VGREYKLYKGGRRQEGSDGSDGVQGGGEEGQEGEWGMGCAGMQNEETSKETVGEWGGLLTIYIVTGIGSHEGGIGQREQSMRRQQEGIMVGRR
jgi:hypothetical protein